jgi:ribonuclease J
MASGSHKFIKIKNSDVIVFSSNPIPGNEKYVVRTVDGLMREGSDVIQNGKTHLTGIGPLHLSGHGYYDDHVKLVNALNPKYYLPIHGEFHMLVHNAELAEQEAGIPRANIFVCDSGDVVEITAEGAKKSGRIPVGGIMYDDSGTVVSEVVLKDRIHMATEGMFVVVLTVQRGSGRLLTSPDIISRGFIYLRDSEELMGTIRQYLKQKVSRAFSGKRVDLDVIKKELKDEITHILYDQTRRTPIVIPVINEVGGQGGGQGGQGGNSGGHAGQQRDNKPRVPRQDVVPGNTFKLETLEPKSFPEPVTPDTPEIDPIVKADNRGY